MQTEVPSFPWLELIDRPAFCVTNGFVTDCNIAAKHCMLQVGEDIHSLITEHWSEYSSLTDGCLYLTITTNGFRHNASVTRTPDYDLFVINCDANDERLHALSLAAQQLRIPLSDIMTVTDQLLASLGDSDSTTKQKANQINHGLFKLLRITCNMSDANRFTHAAVHDMRSVNLTALFDENIEKAKAILSDCGSTLHYTGLDMPVFGLVNEEMLERAVYNLLSNAIKFSPAGSNIDVKLVKIENRLSLTICNPTIDCIAHDRFWNNYQREPSVADSHQGLGLGMTLVSAAAFVHGGTVLVDQPAPSEIRVTMTIPIKSDTSGTVRSPVLSISDYAGGRDKGLLEFADILPAKAYEKTN